MCRNRNSRRRPLLILVVAAGAALGLTRMAGAQTIYTACYVPSSGTIYRIKEPGLRQQCGSTDRKGNTEPHVEFSWASGVQQSTASAPSGGGAKQIDHGSLVGLGDDDHPQYLLANGVRSAVDGFAVSGVADVGNIPASGEGTRMMWYSRKAAFRAGFALDTYWDDANIGYHSVALGSATRASGNASFAAGGSTTASGYGSTALGAGATASGYYATAGGVFAVASGNASLSLGSNTTASGLSSTALGYVTTASGPYSTALGMYASTNGKAGAFVYGDNASSGLTVKAQADNQFVIRAQRFWFGTNSNVTATAGRYIETSTGAYLSTGGAWVSSSDLAKKTEFREVDGEAVLDKLAAMPIRTWRYKEEETGVRHMGPTAQDFRAAFELGDTDKAIAGIDADGVSLAAIQALIKRTNGVQQLVTLFRGQDARIRELENALRAITAEPSARSKN